MHVKGLLKGELKRRNMTYADLVLKLSVLGVEETEVNVGIRSRGACSPPFFSGALKAIAG